MLGAIFWLLDNLINLYIWAIILGAVISLLIAFQVLDTRNAIVWRISEFFYRLTEPALMPIRRFLPNLGGIDISPLILILVLQAARMMLNSFYVAIVRGSVASLL